MLLFSCSFKLGQQLAVRTVPFTTRNRLYLGAVNVKPFNRTIGVVTTYHISRFILRFIAVTICLHCSCRCYASSTDTRSARRSVAISRRTRNIAIKRKIRFELVSSGEAELLPLDLVYHFPIISGRTHVLKKSKDLTTQSDHSLSSG